MRKSAYVTTLLLGSAIALSACSGEQEQEARVYSSIEACAAEQPPEACQEAFREATAQHLLTAPRYSTLQACEADVGDGACEALQQTAGNGLISNVFVPVMAGYLLAEVVDEVGDALKRRKKVGRPLFANRAGYLYSGGNQVGRLGDCNPRARNCERSGSGFSFIGGATAGRVASGSTQPPRWASTVTVPPRAVRNPAPATAESLSRPRSAKLGGTGSRAGGRASS